MNTRPPVPPADKVLAEVAAETGTDPFRLLEEIATDLAEYRELYTTTFGKEPEL